MLQLTKDLEIFHLTRHAKEHKDRSSTSFSPPFELFLRQHRSSAVPRRLSLFCRYGIAMTSNMVAVPRQQTCQLGSSMLFFCLTLLVAVVDARRIVDLFSHFCHIVDDGNHRSTCTSGLFGLCLCFGGLQSISCLPCAPQTSLASRENFCASFFFGSTTIAHLRIRS